MGRAWLAVPRDWVASFGDIAKFAGRDIALVWSGRAFRFFGEALRQAGILILGSTLVIWGLAFILGLQCGIEGAYYGYTASGGPVGVGTATAKSMVLNVVGVHLVGMLGTQVFWGTNPRAPIGG